MAESPPEDWEKGYDGDSDEKAKNQRHVKPSKAGDDPTRTHLQVPGNAEGDDGGTWVDVPKGYVLAPGTEVDDKGVLRKSETGELAIWHHRCKSGNHGPCERWTNPNKYVKEDEVVYIDGAPWCPDCVKKMEDDAKRKQLAEIFKASGNNN